MALINDTAKYKKKAFCFTKRKTVTMGAIRVAGPAIKNANAAPLIMPIWVNCQTKVTAPPPHI